MTFTRALATNNYGPAKFIVDGTTVANGTHSTIAAALTSASSGDTIFIRPGTYTENLTLKAGVNLTAFACDALTPNVIISGNCTHNTAGTVSISGIQLKTNSAANITVSGSVASILNLIGCDINCSNNSGITYSSSSASSQINMYNCTGNLGTTGIKLFDQTSAGTTTIFNCRFTNTGGSSTASTQSAGTLDIKFSLVMSPITTSGSGLITANYSDFDTNALNAIAITHGGSSSSSLNDCEFASGSAASLSTSGTIGLNRAGITSSNTNPVTGAGQLNYTNVSFHGSGLGMNTTTQVAEYLRPGISLSAHQPAFMAFNTVTDTNVTGNGTSYTTISNSEVFDQNSNYNTGTGTFTAPLTGKYFLVFQLEVTGISAMTDYDQAIVTSNRQWDSFRVNPTNILVSTAVRSNCCAFTDMDAADTATARIILAGGALVADVVGDASEVKTGFAGFLVC